MILALIESISGNPAIENESVPKLIKKINKALGFDENSHSLFQVEDLISDITDLDSKVENHTAAIAELEARIKNGIAELDESPNITASLANVPSANYSADTYGKYQHDHLLDLIFFSFLECGTYRISLISILP